MVPAPYNLDQRGKLPVYLFLHTSQNGHTTSYTAMTDGLTSGKTVLFTAVRKSRAYGTKQLHCFHMTSRNPPPILDTTVQLSEQHCLLLIFTQTLSLQLFEQLGIRGIDAANFPFWEMIV